MTSAVSLRNVRLEQGGRVILDAATFDVAAGEFIGLLGANGAGKTTLMRAILGLLPVSAGEIAIGGAPVSRGNPAIGYVPQVRRSLAELSLTGLELVTSVAGGERWGWPFARRRERAAAEAALDLVGAGFLADRPLSAMSGGERQRLLIAQAVMGSPSLLLLDEPLVSLDPSRQSEIVELTARLARERNIAVLFSAHEVNPLMGSIDRVLYLAGGAAVIGPVDEVVTGPVLSRLYHAPIDVVRLDGRIFVMSGRLDMERGGQCGHPHCEDHDHRQHHHAV